MRYWLVLLFLTLSPAVNATEPTERDMKSFRKTVEQQSTQHIFFEIVEMPCFYEHVCASGPIGKYTDCEEVVERCLREAWTVRDKYSEKYYNTTCKTLFNEFTPKQNLMVASPKFCEIDPPAIAYEPTMTKSEADCYCDNYLAVLNFNSPNEKGFCVKQNLECTADMSDIGGFYRSRCRKNRNSPHMKRSIIQYPPVTRNCNITTQTPVLWNGEQAVAEPVKAKVQAFERAHQELLDQSDLDALDF